MWWRLERLRYYLHERYLQDFVFIHINKTAGSSIERALGLRFEHKTALEKRAELGERAWSRRFKFAFVRNPWDKVFSHYNYRLATNQTGLGERPLDFNTWVKLTYGEQHPAYYDQPKMFMPQWNWISDPAGTLLIDFVGRFEHLARDFETVCNRLGRHAELPHLKKTVRNDYRGYYTPASRDIVARWFATDIENFGYSF